MKLLARLQSSFHVSSGLRSCCPVVATLFLLTTASTANAEFKAGATIVDVTPVDLPAIVNGGMRSRSLDTINTRLHARAIAVADDNTTIAIVVVDSCMMPRDFLDEVKGIASKKTGIPAANMLISATHTHSAPSCMGALGTNADPIYVPFLRGQLVQAIETAVKRLEPAQIGFAKIDAGEYTALRRWIRRPDRIAEDPFGNLTVRANMHAANNWDDVTGESGPEDPDLSLISLQTKKGTPIAVLANFSMHYFSDRNISADYFGLFSDGLKARIAPDTEFVGVMSHGCSGDIWRRDYRKPAGERNDKISIEEYTKRLLALALKAYQTINYKNNPTVAMAEKRMTLKYRIPDQQRLEWAQKIVEEMGDRLPKTTTEVYAREQVILHERQQTEVVVQGLRIGDIGIATTPNETYAITGLKVKHASPMKHNIVIELANGGDGYIPPPEQHLFGGYNTWAARSAGLEVTAEPKIAEACIELLEKVSDRSRNIYRQPIGPAAKAIQALKPIAWYRLDEFAGPIAKDSSGQNRLAFYEPRVTYFLQGPLHETFCGGGEKNRAAMFAGGRVHTQLDQLRENYSVLLWIWNGMPIDGRDVAGWFYSRDRNHGLSISGEHLGIGGKSGHTGHLIFQTGRENSSVVAGTSKIRRWTWNHVVMTRNGNLIRVYLNGKLEIKTQTSRNSSSTAGQLFFGGRSDNANNWEGRLDEVAIFDRALNLSEIQKMTVDPSATSAD